MRTEQEVSELMKELDKLTGFIAEHGSLKELYDKNVQFSCNANDAFSWVLCEITNERFIGKAYVNLKHLREIALIIERRTGKKCPDANPGPGHCR